MSEALAHPTVSLVMTVHNRTADVSMQVADSFNEEGNEVDEVVIVLDRPTDRAREGVLRAWGGPNYPAGTKIVELDGEPGWICPARAWNAAYEAATGDLLYQISSEVVQDPGNVKRARERAKFCDVAVFGACHNSEDSQLVIGAEPGLLASSKMTRPLGFIACYPRKAMLAIGGNDLDFMDGLWYEDDDLFLRLWNSGLSFAFDDTIHGVHLDHDRPDLATPEGNLKIQRNANLMLQKHGTLHPWPTLLRVEHRHPDGLLTWTHP